MGWLAASPISPASLGLGLPIGFDLVAVQSCSGLVSGDCWACSILAIRAGVGFVGGSFRLGKGLISGCSWEGFQVWVGVGLICASSGLVGWFGATPHNQSRPEAAQKLLQKPSHTPRANQPHANPNRLRVNLKPSQQHPGYQPFTKPK